jgi:uncharacterized membrane protein
MMWGHGLWLLFPVIFFSKFIGLVLLALLIGFLVRRFTAGPRPVGAWGPVQFPPAGRQAPTQQTSAMELLRQRYARGEIDNTTFEQMRERLEASYAPRQQQ